jgi:hypothetical protein
VEKGDEDVKLVSAMVAQGTMLVLIGTRVPRCRRINQVQRKGHSLMTLPWYQACYTFSQRVLSHTAMFHHVHTRPRVRTQRLQQVREQQ